MSKVFKFQIALLSIMFMTALPYCAHAQYKGSLIKPKEEKKEDPSARPIPRIFSSKVTSVQQAEKLDKLYNDLYISLWNYAATDFIHQKKLFTLIEFKRFKVTRHPKEFSGDIQNAMDDLNQNYNSMLEDIENTEKAYTEIREGIRTIDHEILDELWPEKMEEFKEKAKTYFEMQHKFLKTYRSLIAYIIKQGGSYFYDTREQKLRFYQSGGLQYFAKTFDKLRMMNYQQKKFIKENSPAGISIDTIE